VCPVIQPANPLAPDMHSARVLSEISRSSDKEEGLEAVRKVARKNHESFVAIAAKVCLRMSG
jgi:hypothetical protein